MKYKLPNMFILDEAGMDYVNGHWPYCGDQWPLKCIWRYQHIDEENVLHSLFATVVKNISWILDHNTNHYYKAWQNYINTHNPFANYHQIFHTADQSEITVLMLLFSFSVALVWFWHERGCPGIPSMCLKWSGTVFPWKTNPRAVTLLQVFLPHGCDLWWTLGYWLTVKTWMLACQINDIMKLKYGGPIRVNHMMHMCLLY